MNKIEQGEFLGQLRRVWEGWKPSDLELQDWSEFLATLDFDKARGSFKFWRTHRGGQKGREPLIAKFRPLMLRALLDSGEGAEWVAVFGLRKQGTGLVKRFMDKTMPPPDICMKRAEAMQLAFTDSYGGEWDIIRLWELPEPKPENEVTGEPARLAAYDRMVSGPECPAKTWLTAHVLALANRESREADQRQIDADFKGKTTAERLEFAASLAAVGAHSPADAAALATMNAKNRAKRPPQETAVRIGETFDDFMGQNPVQGDIDGS